MGKLTAVLVLVFLGACASAPKTRVGPCQTTACGDVCCNNDGRVCPYCPGPVADCNSCFDTPGGGRICTLVACLDADDVPN